MLDFYWIFFLRYKRTVNLFHKPRALSCLSVSSYMFPLVMACSAGGTHILCCVMMLSPLDVFPLCLARLHWPLHLVANLHQIIGPSVNINVIPEYRHFLELGVLS